MAYAGSIRHKDPLLCAHGALARHLITRFMLEKAPVPNVLDPDESHHTPLWTGNNPHESISYTQHADSLKAFLEAAGIIITKVTHAFRMYKARDLDEQGVDDGVSGLAEPGQLLRETRFGGRQHAAYAAGSARAAQQLLLCMLAAAKQS